MSNTEFSNDATFRISVGKVLDSLLECVDEIDSDDLDPTLTSGSLQVVFEDTGDTFILSQQTPTHELWLSANLTAWHFRCVGGAWVERDTNEPMLRILGDLFSGKVGTPVEFTL
jgi:iron donor protein CyaY